MSSYTKEFPSPVGPIEVKLVECDECGTRTQERDMLAWLSLSYQGQPLPTLGALPDHMDFCGLTCLIRAVHTMSGMADNG